MEKEKTRWTWTSSFLDQKHNNLFLSFILCRTNETLAKTFPLLDSREISTRRFDPGFVVDPTKDVSFAFLRYPFLLAKFHFVIFNVLLFFEKFWSWTGSDMKNQWWIWRIWSYFLFVDSFSHELLPPGGFWTLFYSNILRLGTNVKSEYPVPVEYVSF